MAALSFHRSHKSLRAKRWVLVALCAWALGATASVAPAAISWDGGGNSNWWFDPVNWSQEAAPGGPFLPPAQDQDGDPNTTPSFIDAQINVGTGAWDVTGEGIVYDPANDPFFDDADDLTYPTGSPLASTPTVMRDYGPETIYRWYVSRNTTNSNLVTIKSGDLIVESTTIIGRSGSTTDPENPGQYLQNHGRVNQVGGSVRFPLITLDLGQREASGWGNGTWDYRAGILEVGLIGGNNPAIRLSAGSTGNGPGGTGRFIMHNPSTPGRVRTWDFTVAAYAGLDEGVSGPDESLFNPALDPDGVITGIGTVEFHFQNGGTRPIQVLRNLSVNNGQDPNTLGTRSARLDLVLDSAPTVNGAGVPGDLGLFDIDFDEDLVGTRTGSGSIGNIFSNASGTTPYTEGEVVSAIFGSTQYNWRISYTGSIAWTNADDSIVASIGGPTTGNDVVLIGDSSQTVVVADADFNNDLKVDGADFLIWQRGLGPGSPATGDADGNGTVDGADLILWRNKYGGPPAVGASGAVPEPHAAALMAVAVLAAGAVRWRRLTFLDCVWKGETRRPRLSA